MLVHYQPIVDLSSECVVRAEALCRLPVQDDVLTTPAAFIAAAERNGHIRDFTESILTAALAARVSWGNDLPISINLSHKNLFESDLRERVLGVLEKFAVDPTELTFELNDGIQSLAEGHGLDTMRHLAISGVRFAIDGFGAIFSAVSDLEIQRLPISELKIDANVVTRLIDARDRGRLDRMVNLVRKADLDIVAKCVETPAQLEAIRFLGCTFAQGYLFGAPLDSDAFAAWLLRDPIRATA